MKITPDFASPCGLYCGVCAIYMAHRDNNLKLKERLVGLYSGKISGKGWNDLNILWNQIIEKNRRLSREEAGYLITDVTEQPVRRPKRRQKKYCGGKKISRYSGNT